MSNTTQDTRIKSTTPKNKQSAKATMKERLAIIMMQSNIINVASTAGGSHQYCSMNLFIEKSDSLNYKDSNLIYYPPSPIMGSNWVVKRQKTRELSLAFHRFD